MSCRHAIGRRKDDSGLPVSRPTVLQGLTQVHIFCRVSVPPGQTMGVGALRHNLPSHVHSLWDYICRSGAKLVLFWAVRREGFGGAPMISIWKLCAQSKGVQLEACEDNRRADGRKAWVTGFDHVYQWHPARAHAHVVAGEIICKLILLRGRVVMDSCSDNWRPPLPGNWPTNARPAAGFGLRTSCLGPSSARIHCAWYFCMLLKASSFCNYL